MCVHVHVHDSPLVKRGIPSSGGHDMLVHDESFLVFVMIYRSSHLMYCRHILKMCIYLHENVSKVLDLQGHNFLQVNSGLIEYCFCSAAGKSPNICWKH